MTTEKKKKPAKGKGAAGSYTIAELAGLVGTLGADVANLKKAIAELASVKASPAAGDGDDYDAVIVAATENFLKRELKGSTLPWFIEKKIRELFGKAGVQVADELGLEHLRELCRDIARDEIAELKRKSPMARLG
jgi:hypothetical protein